MTSVYVIMLCIEQSEELHEQGVISQHRRLLDSSRGWESYSTSAWIFNSSPFAYVDGA